MPNRKKRTARRVPHFRPGKGLLKRPRKKSVTKRRSKPGKKLRATRKPPTKTALKPRHL